ncbi:MAG: DUF188 domain-containing protein [Treponema sp.]|jgi:uncharacterized protein YaiI (UPF0178 family)|nr:DUF188 domain-containing protein [Treponema sp.]
MKILVDADSCPRAARDLVLRRAARSGTPAVFAANRPIPGIAGDNISMELCPPGEDSADKRIVELARPGDLAVTRDLPLAEQLVNAGIRVLDDRGRIFTPENIRELRSLRDFMVGLAQNNLTPERASAYGKKELKAFADSFDKELTKK